MPNEMAFDVGSRLKVSELEANICRVPGQASGHVAVSPSCIVGLDRLSDSVPSKIEFGVVVTKSLMSVSPKIQIPASPLLVNI